MWLERNLWKMALKYIQIVNHHDHDNDEFSWTNCTHFLWGWFALEVFVAFVVSRKFPWPLLSWLPPALFYAPHEVIPELQQHVVDGTSWRNFHVLKWKYLTSSSKIIKNMWAVAETLLLLLLLLLLEWLDIWLSPSETFRVTERRCVATWIGFSKSNSAAAGLLETWSVNSTNHPERSLEADLYQPFFLQIWW